jgi:hypothetical protein
MKENVQEMCLDIVSYPPHEIYMPTPPLILHLHLRLHLKSIWIMRVIL